MQLKCGCLGGLLLVALLSSTGDSRFFAPRCAKNSVSQTLTVGGCPVVVRTDASNASRLLVEPLVCLQPWHLSDSAVLQPLAFDSLRQQVYVRIPFSLRDSAVQSALTCRSEANSTLATFMDVLGIEISMQFRPKNVVFDNAKIDNGGDTGSVSMYCTSTVICTDMWVRLRKKPELLRDVLAFRLTVLPDPRCYRKSLLTRSLSLANAASSSSTEGDAECNQHCAESATPPPPVTTSATLLVDFRTSCKNLATPSADAAPAEVAVKLMAAGRVDGEGITLGGSSTGAVVAELPGWTLGRLRESEFAVVVRTRDAALSSYPYYLFNIGSCTEQQQWANSARASAQSIGFGGVAWRLPATTTNATNTYGIVFKAGSVSRIIFNGRAEARDTTGFAANSSWRAGDRTPACLRFRPRVGAGRSVSLLCWAAGPADILQQRLCE